MKKIIPAMIAPLLIGVLLLPGQSLFGREAKVFRFKAEMTNAISSSSDALNNGIYEVLLNDGQAEAYQILEGQRTPVGPNTSAELKRMVGIDEEKRGYINLPLSVGKQWSQTHDYRLAGGLRTRKRAIDFRVVSESELPTDAGTFHVFQIEGNARIRMQSGIVEQKWVYYYAPDASAIVKYYYDSNVSGGGAKITIELVRG